MGTWDLVSFLAFSKSDNPQLRVLPKLNSS